MFAFWWRLFLLFVGSPPPAVYPLGALIQFTTFAGTSLCVSGCSCNGSVALLRAGSVVVLCHPSVKGPMAAKANSPVWGFHPLHHVAGDVWELSLATLRYSSG